MLLLIARHAKETLGMVDKWLACQLCLTASTHKALGVPLLVTNTKGASAGINRLLARGTTGTEVLDVAAATEQLLLLHQELACIQSGGTGGACEAGGMPLVITAAKLGVASCNLLVARCASFGQLAVIATHAHNIVLVLDKLLGLLSSKCSVTSHAAKVIGMPLLSLGNRERGGKDQLKA